MDERRLQLKQLKKRYQKLRAVAGRGWKVLGWLFFIVCLLLVGAALFVRWDYLPFVQWLDRELWEPVKAALNLGIDYGYFRNLAERYGLIAGAFSGVLWLLCAVPVCCKRSAVRKSDEYLSYRTVKLTLEAEKKEK